MTVSTPIYQIARPIYYLVLSPALTVIQILVNLLQSVGLYAIGMLTAMIEPIRRLKAPLQVLRTSILGNAMHFKVVSQIGNGILMIFTWCKVPFVLLLKLLSTVVAKASTFEFDSQKERLAAILRQDSESDVTLKKEN